MKIKRIIMKVLGIKPKRRRTGAKKGKTSKKAPNRTIEAATPDNSAVAAEEPQVPPQQPQNQQETKPNADENTEKKEYTSGDFRNEMLPRKYGNEILNLTDEIEHDDYIANLRVGRSWVLPQLLSRAYSNGHFYRATYLAYAKNIAVDKQWEILMRNVKAMAKIIDKDSAGYKARARWWTRDVILQMIKVDFKRKKADIMNLCQNKSQSYCEGGDFIRITKWDCHYGNLFFINPPLPGTKWKEDNSTTVHELLGYMKGDIEKMSMMKDDRDFLKAVIAYYNHGIYRVKNEKHVDDSFANAFAGDGAYTAMMTLVKYHKLCYEDSEGRMMSRDECIVDIEQKAEEFKGDGMKLWDYLALKFEKRQDLQDTLFPIVYEEEDEDDADDE